MRLFGLEISRVKTQTLQSLDRGNWWWPVVREPFTGAWQRNMELRRETVVTYSAVYSCVTLIASDIAKNRICLVEQDENGIWNEVKGNSPFWPVLRKPNDYQNRIKFFEHWVVSKLIHGNTYVLKERDARGVVVALYVLDPTKTKPLVAPNGDIYYQLSQDNLSGVTDSSLKVPASEIIHDVMVPLYHPLCGVSPLTACGLAAAQGMAIQHNTLGLFSRGARPSGVLTAPGTLSDPDAKRFKEYWEENFSGDNAGKVAVLGGGLKFEAMTMNAVDAQLIEQLKWSAQTVCSCYHVPAYMIGIGELPKYDNIEAQTQQYYAQALQSPIECIELLLDEGLGLTEFKDKVYGTEFDTDGLLRMDTKTLVDTELNAAKGLKTVNEARKRLNYGPVTGGDAVYRQQQDFSLEALAKRDASSDPFGKAQPTPPANNDNTDQTNAASFEAGFTKAFA